MGESTSADMDGGWKQLIEDYLEEFFRFFFPQVHAEAEFAARMCLYHHRIWP